MDDDHDLEVIRHQMEETRSSLADKLETLETQLGETVEVATEAVSSTVETVQETVETVKETLDPRIQVERHPWLMMTGAVAAGYIAGCMLDFGPTRQASPPRPPLEQWSAPRPSAPAPAQAPAPSAAKKEGPFDSSIEKLKGLAIGSLMSIARELVSKIAPATLTTDLVSVVDDLTTRLGGKPLRREPQSTEPECREEEDSSEAGTPATGSTEAAPPRPKTNGRGKRRPARI